MKEPANLPNEDFAAAILVSEKDRIAQEKLNDSANKLCSNNSVRIIHIAPKGVEADEDMIVSLDCFG